MKQYEVFDTRQGLFTDNLNILAVSPRQALLKAGYKKAQRSTNPNAPVVVYGGNASYLYFADK